MVSFPGPPLNVSAKALPINVSSPARPLTVNDWMKAAVSAKTIWPLRTTSICVGSLARGWTTIRSFPAVPLTVGRVCAS